MYKKSWTAAGGAPRVAIRRNGNNRTNTIPFRISASVSESHWATAKRVAATVRPWETKAVAAAAGGTKRSKRFLRSTALLIGHPPRQISAGSPDPHAAPRCSTFVQPWEGNALQTTTNYLSDNLQELSVAPSFPPCFAARRPDGAKRNPGGESCISLHSMPATKIARPDRPSLPGPPPENSACCARSRARRGRGSRHRTRRHAG